MLTDYCFAADLSISDRLRLLADAHRRDPLAWRTLHAAADQLEEQLPDLGAPPVRDGASP